MKITCQSCQAKYTIADEKVLGKIVKIRCKKCGATIVINGNESGAGSQSNQAAADAQAYDYAGGAAAGDQWTVNVADGDQRPQYHRQRGLDFGRLIGKDLFRAPTQCALEAAKFAVGVEGQHAGAAAALP